MIVHCCIKRKIMASEIISILKEKKVSAIFGTIFLIKANRVAFYFFSFQIPQFRSFFISHR